MSHKELFKRLEDFHYNCARKSPEFPGSEIEIFLSTENYKSFQVGCHEMWQMMGQRKVVEDGTLTFSTVHFCGIKMTAYMDPEGQSNLMVYYCKNNRVITEKL